MAGQYERIWPDGTSSIKHDEYQKSLKVKTKAELRWAAQDANKAVMANPLGVKAGYYRDEAIYCSMELQSRGGK